MKTRSTFRSPRGDGGSSARVLEWPLIAVLLGGAVLGVLVVVDPALGLAAMGLAVLALAVLVKPDLAVCAVIFILFSNVAVVAVKFHGVPRVVASAFPLLLGAPLVRDVVLRRRGIVMAPALPFLVLLLGVQTIGAVFARDPGVAKTTVVEFVTEGLLLYFLMTNAVRTPRALRLSVWAVVLAGAFSAVVPCYQQLTGAYDRSFGGLGQTSEVGFRTGEFTTQGEVRQMRLAGPIGEQNRYAQNMLMFLVLGLFVFLGERDRSRRRLALLFTAVVGMGFFLAFSRGGAVAFVLVLLSMVCLRLVHIRHVLVLGLVAAVFLLAMPQYWARLRTVGDLSAFLSGRPQSEEIDSAIRGRVTEMVAAAQVFIDHPVIGVGPGMFKYYSAEYGNRLGIRKLTGTRKAHSLYLEIAAEGGVLGLASFAGLVLVTLHGLLVARRRLLGAVPGETDGARGARLELLSLVTGLLLALIAYLASAIFLHLAYVRFFYGMLALAAAASSVGLARHADNAGDGITEGSLRPAAAPETARPRVQP